MENLDLHTIKVLANLYQTQHPSHTSSQMNISLLAVDKALEKARESLNDPLFTRIKGTLSPSPLMTSIMDKLPSLISQINDVTTLNQFDPYQLTGQYHIYLDAQLQQTFGPAIYHSLSSRAPKATWSIAGWKNDAIDKLIAGNITLGINYFSSDLPTVIHQETLLDDTLVVLASQQHPLHNTGKIELAQLAEYNFVSLNTPFLNEQYHNIHQLLTLVDKKANVAMETDSMVLAVTIAEQQSLLLLGSKLLIDEGSVRLKPIELNFDSGLAPKAKIVCSYASRRNNDPLIIWLKSELLRVFNASACESVDK